MHELSVRERIAFFLNVYQCMYIHNFLKVAADGVDMTQAESYFQTLKSLVISSGRKPFFYSMGGFNFTLDEIKNGILRGNKRPPSAYLARALSWNDPKAQFVKELNDGRVNFVCLDLPDIVEHTDSFASEEDLNERLDKFVAEILNAKVNVDTVQGEITLPKLLQTYKNDFCNGTDEGLLRFVFKYYSCGSEAEDEAVVKEVCQRKTMIIRFE